MSKLKSIMHNRTHGHLGEQRRSCSDCIHVMPATRGDEVTCEIYTFKHEAYNVPKRSALSPAFANDCGFYQAMTPVQKAESERKFREFFKRLE
jgi:hypothetical protein